MKLMTLSWPRPGMDMADTLSMDNYNADGCLWAFELKIGYLPIPLNPVPRLSQSHSVIKKDQARTS